MKIESIADMDMVKRREFAKNNPIFCISCGTNQVQLTDYTSSEEMRWKCRHCGCKMITTEKRWVMEVAE